MDAIFSGLKAAYFDFSYDLRDRRDWKIATIREVEYLADISAIAVEATNGLVAIGTKTGKILLFGAPQASNVLRVPRATSVKFLQFAALVFKLICVDDKGTLHVWDLSQLGHPKLVASEAYREPICSLTVSPCHSHAFIGLERRRVILTYDTLCLHRSPYIIPDVWTKHEQVALHSGIPLSSVPNSTDLMDIVVHPRDLNIIFLAYAGGVALYDLTERRATGHYELVIPPGAPGALGYYDPDILKARRPPLTAIAVHASGQLFVTGHLDGTVAFWAVDDEGRPLMVRTIGKLDINFPEGVELDKALSDPHRPSPETLRGLQIEPIFKLSWCSFGSQTASDPYSGATVLTILGGFDPQAKETGVTTLRLPPLILPSPSTPSVRGGLHPEIRKALVKPLSSTNIYVYPTVGAATDYLYIPKESPHFGGCFDAVAILVVYEWPAGQRSIYAKEFPPPPFGLVQSSSTPIPSSSDKELENPLDAELSTTLQSLKLSSDPKDYTQSLPSALWTGMTAVCDGDIVRLEKEEYDRLQCSPQVPATPPPSKVGRGGIAWVDYGDYDQAQDLLSTKRQPNRLLVTHHRNLTVNFQDITAQLLIGSAASPLTTAYPAPLPHLTIALPLLLSESCIAEASHPLPLAQAEIQAAQLTSESGECAIAMRSGHVFVYRYDERQRNVSDITDEKDGIVRLAHIPAEAGTFQPMLMVENRWGAVSACELSNIGFLAVAYSSGALIIVDMRHPKIILQDEGDAKAQKRISVSLHLHNAEDEKRIVTLRWFICGFDEDPTPRVRLLVSRRSGASRLFTLTQSASRIWEADADVQRLDGAEHPLPRGSFVINAKNGTSRTASRATFKEALQGHEDPVLAKEGKDKDEGPHCFWVSAGEKGARCQANFGGGRAGKAEWGKGRKVECVEVVTRNGAQGLVAIMDTREALVYSLPALELIQTFQLIKQPNSAFCLDDTGDFVDWTFDAESETVSGALLGTLFAIRRVYDEPAVDYTAGRRAAPGLAPRVPLSPISYVGAWFNFRKGASGDAMDALLAGPNRPIPQDAPTSVVVNREWQNQIQSHAQALAAQASRTGSDLYSNLSAAVSERGEVLSGLDESFRNLEEGGRNMLFEAKKLAAGQSGKRWFGF